MKCVILAGGLGTRLSEETEAKPKPMVEIGGRPILWHIMKLYASYGITDFVVCCGYRGYVIKEFFWNYSVHSSDICVNLAKHSIEVLRSGAEDWNVTLIDTGAETMTGGRLKRIREYVGNETFCMTYGDGVSDVNIKELVRFHREQKKLATVTAVQPPGRFGALSFDSADPGSVASFLEKPQGDGAYINGGFFVLEPKALEGIAGDSTSWEQEPMQNLAHSGQMAAFKHDGFWQAMDTLRDKRKLEELWQTNRAPWKRWD